MYKLQFFTFIVIKDHIAQNVLYVDETSFIYYYINNCSTAFGIRNLIKCGVGLNVRCGAAFCGMRLNDATCYTIPHRNALHPVSTNLKQGVIKELENSKKKFVIKSKQMS